MLACNEVTRLVSDSQERALQLRERFALRMHVMMCSGCRNFERHMQTLRHGMRHFAKKRHDREEQPPRGP